MFHVSRVESNPDDDVAEFERLEDAWSRAIRLSEYDEEPVSLLGQGIDLLFIDGTAYQSVSFAETEARLSATK